MGKIFTIANQKGGVGKTTTCVNLGASLAATHRRVLLVDLDPQGNATMGCGINKNALEQSGCDVLLGDVDIRDAIISVEAVGMDVLPSNSDLTAAEVGLMSMPDRERRLRSLLQPIRDDYHYILIDCPPSLNMLTVNALAAAEGVIIPMQCEYYALEGLSSLIETIETIRRSLNPALRLEGLLRTMFDPRNNLANQVAAQLTSHFGDRVYNAVIPRNVRLAEAPSHGLPVIKYDKSSRGAMAYLALAGEIIRKEAKQPVTGMAS
jgi:chromosome partitioning protein